jgi:plasmid stabilization system protein ParE
VRRYRLSPEAEGDLDDIKRYLMQQGAATRDMMAFT